MNLKDMRVSRGLTQIEATKKIGVSLATYRLWEAEVTTPNEENQKKLDLFLEDKQTGDEITAITKKASLANKINERFFFFRSKEIPLFLMGAMPFKSPLKRKKEG